MQPNDAMEPFSEHAWQMEREHHVALRWLYVVAVVLGAWLVFSPFVFGHADPDLAGPGVAHVTAERDLPPIELRGTLMAWSDAISGVTVIVLALLSLSHRRVWAQWALGILIATSFPRGAIREQYGGWQRFVV